ncbi:type II secretion system GspH family protein [Candidatus Pelagibacter sp.]|nr:type II secretion system GspH family protein [Candidatus Pelagibacter sp.]
MNQRSKLKAFTLIELIVVVAIIGILGTIGVLTYNGYVRTAENQIAILVVGEIRLAQNEFRNFSGNFSNDTTCTATSSPSDTTTATINTNLLARNIIPTDRAFNYCSTTGGAASNNPGELIIFAERINDPACTITYNPANGTTALAGCE